MYENNTKNLTDFSVKLRYFARKLYSSRTIFASLNDFFPVLNQPHYFDSLILAQLMSKKYDLKLTVNNTLP